MRWQGPAADTTENRRQRAGGLTCSAISDRPVLEAFRLFGWMRSRLAQAGRQTFRPARLSTGLAWRRPVLWRRDGYHHVAGPQRPEALHRCPVAWARRMGSSTGGVAAMSGDLSGSSASSNRAAAVRDGPRRRGSTWAEHAFFVALLQPFLHAERVAARAAVAGFVVAEMLEPASSRPAGILAGLPAVRCPCNSASVRASATRVRELRETSRSSCGQAATIRPRKRGLQRLYGYSRATRRDRDRAAPGRDEIISEIFSGTGRRTGSHGVAAAGFEFGLLLTAGLLDDGRDQLLFFCATSPCGQAELEGGSPKPGLNPARSRFPAPRGPCEACRGESNGAAPRTSRLPPRSADGHAHHPVAGRPRAATPGVSRRPAAPVDRLEPGFQEIRCCRRWITAIEDRSARLESRRSRAFRAGLTGSGLRG